VAWLETANDTAGVQRASAATSLAAPRSVEPLRRQIERLLDRLRLTVIFSGDRSVPGAVINPTVSTRPWKSYEAVAQDIADALRRLGFRHVQLMPDDMRLGDRLRREQIHFAWLNTGGVQGYNPACHAPAMLEMVGIPYVGHDPFIATTLDNKHTFKRELNGAGIPTAPFMTWHLARGPFLPKLNSRFLRAFGDYGGPFVVKPVSGRASLHVQVVDEVRHLPDAVEEVFIATENLVLIESYLPGREFCVAVCGPITARGFALTRHSTPFVFSRFERVLEADEKIFTSMDVRPIRDDRIQPLDPVADAAIAAELRTLARDVFLEFNLGSLVRLDLRADARGRLHILEANVKPDLKRPNPEQTSLVCAGLGEFGMSYDDLILSLFADRLDMLQTQRRASVRRVLELAEQDE
jgi:D-alanine-D-alanine ligase